MPAGGCSAARSTTCPGCGSPPEFSYTRRPRAELAQLRETFNGGVRQDFLKSLDQGGALQRAGFSPTEIARIRAGKVPGRDWSVHHILPLDDGGTNSFDNLVLIRNSPDHQLVTNHQHYVTADLPVGDTRTVPWIHYPPGTRVWPPTPTANRPTIVTHPDVP